MDMWLVVAAYLGWLAGVFHTAEEEQSGDISARLPSLNYDYQLVDGC